MTQPLPLPTTKLCAACGETKPLDDFYFYKKGVLSRDGKCKVCVRALGREHYRENLSAGRARALRVNKAIRVRFLPWLATLKARPCMDCGGTFPPECMDFDHVRGEKKFQINNNAFGRSAAALFAEIDKCDLVCANCHRVRTTRRKRAAQ